MGATAATAVTTITTTTTTETKPTLKTRRSTDLTGNYFEHQLLFNLHLCFIKMIRTLALTLAALASVATAQRPQRWTWTKTNSWPTGNFEGMLCLKKLDPSIEPNCGWKLQIDIKPAAKTLNVYWPMILDSTATLKKKWKTTYTVSSADWAPKIDEFDQNQEKGCYKIQFQLDNDQSELKRVTAQLVQVCQDGADVEVTKAPKVTKAPTTPGPSTTTTTTPKPRVEPTDADFMLMPPSNEWNQGTKQEVCLYHTRPIRCDWEAEFVFKGDADISGVNLEIWKGKVVETLVRSPTEVRQRVINQDWYKVPDEGEKGNPVCIEVQYQYPEGKKPALAARFTKVCVNTDEDKWSKKPNVGGTVPPMVSTTTTSTTTTTA